MNLSDFQRMFAYDTWANREVVASFRKSGSGPKSMKYLAHLLSAGQLWLDRLNGSDRKVAVWPDPDHLEEYEAQVAELGARWQAFLEDAGERGLSRTITYTNSKGEPWSSRVDDILTHVLMHGAYHRGQIASDTRSAGFIPAYTDFIHAVRQHHFEMSA